MMRFRFKEHFKKLIAGVILALCAVLVNRVPVISHLFAFCSIIALGRFIGAMITG